MNNYDVETAEYLAHGLTLFQYGLFGNSELEHVQRFCELVHPRGVVVDMGAGIGTMGKLMREVCPEVETVINITNSAEQAKIADANNERVVLSDFHAVPEVPTSSADVVMFNESFGYGDPGTLMAESARMLKTGGMLVIKDFSVNTRLLDTVVLPGWEYRVFPQHEILHAAAKTGLRCLMVLHPITSTERWAKFMQQSKMAQWHGTTNYDGRAAVFVFVRAQAQGAFEC